MQFACSAKLKCLLLWLSDKSRDVEMADLLVFSYCAETRHCRLIKHTHTVTGQQFSHFRSVFEKCRDTGSNSKKKGISFLCSNSMADLESNPANTSCFPKGIARALGSELWVGLILRCKKTLHKSADHVKATGWAETARIFWGVLRDI